MTDEHANEIINLKKDLRITQDSVLLIHRDLQTMSTGISEMASSMKIMVEVQSDMRLMNERSESRHQAQKEVNALLHLRIDVTNKKVDSNTLKVSHGETAYGILKWIGITVGSLLITSIVGAWLYVIVLQGVK